MKHNFLAWRLLDAAVSEKGGGSEAIVKSIKELGDKHLEQMKAVEAAQKSALEAKATELQNEISGLKGQLQKATDDVTEMKQKAATSNVTSTQQVKGFGVQMEAKLNENKDKLPLSKSQKFSFDIETKAVGNFSSSNNLTGSYFVAPDVQPGIIAQPFNQVHMRNILSTGNTNSNIIRYVRDNGGEGGPAMTAEGGSKPQMDRDLQVYDAPVRKLATHMRVPEEMIEDIPFLTSFLTNIGTEEVLAVEDAQILYGDGTGQNLSGIGLSGNFTAFAAGTSVIGASAQEFDVLRAADKQMRQLKRTPTIALVSPVDYYNMISRKDSTNNYILSGGGNGLIPTINGFPVVQMNQVTAGDFFVMDAKAAQIFFRSNITVRFYEQDQDNAIKNLVTIVIEERLALPIYYVTGIIKGTFSTAITDLTS